MAVKSIELQLVVQPTPYLTSFDDYVPLDIMDHSILACLNKAGADLKLSDLTKLGVADVKTREAILIATADSCMKAQHYRNDSLAAMCRTFKVLGTRCKLIVRRRGYDETPDVLATTENDEQFGEIQETTTAKIMATELEFAALFETQSGDEVAIYGEVIVPLQNMASNSGECIYATQYNACRYLCDDFTKEFEERHDVVNSDDLGANGKAERYLSATFPAWKMHYSLRLTQNQNGRR